LPHHTSKDIKCPKCGSDTTIRTVKKGTNAGEKYFVCICYPDCKGKVLATTENKQSTEQRQRRKWLNQVMHNPSITKNEQTEEEQPKEANTRSKQHKILLVILAVGIGLAVQVLSVPLVYMLGDEWFELGAVLSTILGFVVMGYLIYRWVT